jgi:hypothetical protein
MPMPSRYKQEVVGWTARVGVPLSVLLHRWTPALPLLGFIHRSSKKVGVLGSSQAGL